MNSIEHSVPNQEKGIKKAFSSARKFISLEDAQLCYATAVSRLLNINHWPELVPVKCNLQIMSKNARPQRRRARVHDLVRIGLPAPGNEDGNGYDWVEVETLKFLTGKRKEQCLLTLRPCPAPGAEHTAHFFSSASTSSFLLTRSGNVVMAAYYGRNEMPNTSDTSGMKETARNVAVATGAMLGFSDAMWGPLMESLIMDGTKLRERIRQA